MYVSSIKCVSNIYIYIYIYIYSKYPPEKYWFVNKFKR